MTFKYFLQLIIEFIYIRKEKYFVHSIQLEKLRFYFYFSCQLYLFPLLLHLIWL